jgi:hypothetical protein
MIRPPRSRAVRLRGQGARRKAPLDANWPTLVLPDRLYFTSRRWWGCRTGAGLWVLDFDLKEGHDRVLTYLTRQHGPIPGWHVRSGSGGRHVYMRGPGDLPPRYRIPVEGHTGVELHANPASQVVWPSAPGYQPLSERPDPLPDAPAWLIELAEAPSPSPAATGGRIGRGLLVDEPSPEVYVLALLGEIPDGQGTVCCPAHGDTHPSLHIYRDHVHCFPCGYSTRARGLAALLLGLGRIERGRVVVDGDDRATADTYWREAVR